VAADFSAGGSGGPLRTAGAAAFDTPTAVIMSTNHALVMAYRNIASPFIEKSPGCRG
jgi:hypothetical protein